MKQVAGFADCPGTYIVYALDWLQSDRSGDDASEQIRIRAISIVKLPRRRERTRLPKLPYARPSMRILLLPEPQRRIPGQLRAPPVNNLMLSRLLPSSG